MDSLAQYSSNSESDREGEAGLVSTALVNARPVVNGSTAPTGTFVQHNQLVMKSNLPAYALLAPVQVRGHRARCIHLR